MLYELKMASLTSRPCFFLGGGGVTKFPGILAISSPPRKTFTLDKITSILLYVFSSTELIKYFLTNTRDPYESKEALYAVRVSISIIGFIGPKIC